MCNYSTYVRNILANVNEHAAHLFAFVCVCVCVCVGMCVCVRVMQLQSHSPQPFMQGYDRERVPDPNWASGRL